MARKLLVVRMIHSSAEIDPPRPVSKEEERIYEPFWKSVEQSLEKRVGGDFNRVRIYQDGEDEGGSKCAREYEKEAKKRGHWNARIIVNLMNKGVPPPMKTEDKEVRDTASFLEKMLKKRYKEKIDFLEVIDNHSRDWLNSFSRKRKKTLEEGMTAWRTEWRKKHGKYTKANLEFLIEIDDYRTDLLKNYLKKKISLREVGNRLEKRIRERGERIKKVFGIFHDKIHELRDGPIAKNISQSLNERETGVLFIGKCHRVEKPLRNIAPDIEIEYLAEDALKRLENQLQRLEKQGERKCQSLS